jgi:hypothetical protein
MLRWPGPASPRPACQQTSPAAGDGSVAGILEENGGGLGFPWEEKAPQVEGTWGAGYGRVCVGPGTYGQGAPDTFAQLMMPFGNEVGVAAGQTADSRPTLGVAWRSSARCPLTSGAANEVPTQ